MINRYVFVAATLGVTLVACSTPPVKRIYTPSIETASEPKSKMDLIKNAQASYLRGEYGNALSILNSVPESNLRPTEKTEYYNLKGLIRLAEKNPTSAAIDFRKAIESNTVPEHASFYQYNLATSFAELGKKEEALKTLEQIDAINMPASEQKKIIVLKERLKKGYPAIAQQNEPTNSTGMGVAFGALTPEQGSTEYYSGNKSDSKIGLLVPLSGKYESFGKKVQKAIELAFQTSTDSRARDYEIIAIDSGETPNSHVDALKKLVEEYQVSSVLGPILAKPLEALKAKANFYQVPLLSLAQAQADPNSFIYSCSISLKDQTSKLVDYAINTRGFNRFAILAPKNKSGDELANLFWDEVEAKGAEVRAFETYNPESTDFREPVDRAIGLFYTEARAEELKALSEKREELKITKKTMKTIQHFELPPLVDFDAVFIADEARVAGQIIPTLAYRNVKNMNYLGISTWNSSQLLSRAGELSEGAVFPVAFNTISPPPETKQFYDLYFSKYSSYPGELDAIAFDAAAVLIKAKRDGNFDSITSVQGATGELQLRDHQCARTLPLFQVKKGAFELLK